MTLFIAAPDIHVGDAVGNHCLGIARAAQRLGVPARACAKHFTGDVEPLDTLFEQIQPQDTLLVSYSIYDPMLERLLALENRKLCYFHGVTEPELLREFEPVTADLCARSLEQYPLLRQFDLVMANSRLTAASLAPHLRADEILVIPPVWPDMPLFRHVPAEQAQRTGPLTLLVVGRVVPHKRVEDAIEILALVREAGVDAKLEIVGGAPNGVYLAFLRERAAQRRVAEHVEITGMIDDENLFARFDRAGALLSVSQHEGFCVPVLEAMHLGVPTFVRSGTAASEVGAEATVSFDTLDQARAAILQLHGDPARRVAMVDAGKRRAEAVLAQADDKALAAVLSVPRQANNF